MKIIRTFKGHTALNQQSSMWIEIEPNENIEDLINLYSELQRQSKIIVSNKYELLSHNLISISYVYLDCSIKTLESIKRIFNGDDKELVSNELKSDLQNWSEFGQNNAYFLNDALEIGIPFRKIDYTVYTIGTGIYGKSFSSTSTRNTSYIGVSIAKNKLQSSNLLRLGGFPAPIHTSVSNIEEAIMVAEQIGYPVVVKPLDRDNGDGVFSGIRNVDDLKLFFNESKKYSDSILIEKHQEGFGHRIAVYNDFVISTTKKLPWGITGDGKSTIRELLPNTDIEILSMIRDQNLTLETILESDIFIPLRRRNNASASGKTINLESNEVHPDNIKLAFDVAKLFNLDIVGIDLIISDISKSWLNTPCVICDVNAIPQIGFDRVKNIFNSIFKDGFRIPVFLAISKNINDVPMDKLKSLTGANGVSTPDGVWINDTLVSNRFSDGFDSARSMIFDDRVERGLVIMTEIGVKRFGLPLDIFNTVFLNSVDLDNDLTWILKGQNIINLNG
jgi:cyanophycin synthetase